jgi:hypothetical protein
LLDASNDDFASDIINMMRHLDRTTGKFRDGFHPRCAAHWVTGITRMCGSAAGR